jgi:hypothetical protein
MQVRLHLTFRNQGGIRTPKRTGEDEPGTRERTLAPGQRQADWDITKRPMPFARPSRHSLQLPKQQGFLALRASIMRRLCPHYHAANQAPCKLMHLPDQSLHDQSHTMRRPTSLQF